MGYLTKFNIGRLRPEVQPSTLFLYHFDRKGTPFIYLLLQKKYPFLSPCNENIKHYHKQMLSEQQVLFIQFMALFNT